MNAQVDQLYSEVEKLEKDLFKVARECPEAVELLGPEFFVFEPVNFLDERLLQISERSRLLKLALQNIIFFETHGWEGALLKLW